MQEVKSDISSKFLKTRAKTALRIQNEFGQNEECVKLDDALNLIGQVRLSSKAKFLKENEAYIINATKMLEMANKVLSEVCDKEKDASDYALKASEFVEAMKESNTPILCIRVNDYNNAVSLTKFYQKLLLLRKYEKDIPEGTLQLERLEGAFENLCSIYKIGRRTKSIIKKQHNKY